MRPRGCGGPRSGHLSLGAAARKLERFVRMDTVMPLIQKRFDEKGKLPNQVMLALTQGVDAAWARVKEGALNGALTSALLLTVAFDGSCRSMAAKTSIVTIFCTWSWMPSPFSSVR